MPDSLTCHIINALGFFHPSALRLRSAPAFSMRPLRVFLCHASQDKPAVRELYNALKAEGWIDPWLDKAKILPGQDWRVVIEKAVEASDVVMACLSCQSVSKEGFVQREIKYACDLASEKPEETIFLIPLRLEDCIVPRGLRSLQWADYFGAEKEETYNDLLAALRLRYDQKMELEADESERQQADEVARREAREFAHKVAAEKSVREEMEREAAELAAREKREREAKRKIAREAKPVLEPIEKKTTSYLQSLPNVAIWWGIGLLITLAITFFFFLWKTSQSDPLVFTPTPKEVLPNIIMTATLPPTKFSIATPTLGVGSTTIGEHGEILVYVPKGEFTMGSDVNSDEQPIHKVYLDAFWIDQTEVTNKQYKACVDAGTCEPPSSTNSYTHPSYYGNPEFDDYPVIYVNWDKANRYCEVWTGTGGDLPTEAQWEKAARGTDARTYPWGNDAPNKDLLNYNSIVGDTTKVGNYKTVKSFYGTYDMAGNVWEWANDWYDETYYKSSNSSNNPLGPESGQYRVLRGGSWPYNYNYVRSAFRNRNYPTVTYDDFGFRCSRSLPVP